MDVYLCRIHAPVFYNYDISSKRKEPDNLHIKCGRKKNQNGYYTDIDVKLSHEQPTSMMSHPKTAHCNKSLVSVSIAIMPPMLYNYSCPVWTVIKTAGLGPLLPRSGPISFPSSRKRASPCWPLPTLSLHPCAQRHIQYPPCDARREASVSDPTCELHQAAVGEDQRRAQG